MTHDNAGSAPNGLVQLVVMVLAPFSLGYFFSYMYRAVNAVVAPDLVRDVGLSASELGLLTAAYLFGFAGFQLPLGLLLDRFGPRRVQAALVCVAATGAVIFSWGESLAALFFARMLIGAGSAGGLMAGFKAVTLWVPAERRALANAVIMAAGGLGILTATVPAEWATQAFGWRGMFFYLSIVTVVVAALIFALVPDPEASAKSSASVRDQVRAIGMIYRDPVFWRIAPLVTTTCGVHIGIQTLWAGPWLRDVAGYDRDAVAATLGWMAIGFLIGTLMSGAAADWLGRRGISLLQVTTGFVLVYLLSTLAILMEPVAYAVPVWFAFGMFGQAAILTYPWFASYFGVQLAGRANTAMNFLVFSGAFLSQYAIGGIIDLWPTSAEGHYDRAAYQVAFGLLLALQILCFVWYLMKLPRDGARLQEG